MISIITAHQEHRKNYLLECYETIIKQGEGVEWLIQVDGEEYSVPKKIQKDPRVFIESNGMHLGAANTRNLALRRAEGEYIFSLDDDDLLFEDSLQRVVDLLRRSSLPAAIPNVYKVNNTGVEPWNSHGIVSSNLYPIGKIERGQIIKNKDRFGTHCLPSCAVLWRADWLRNVIGGWPAVKGSEDTAVLARTNSKSPVLRVDVDLLLYRVHGNQESSDDNILRLRKKNWEIIKRTLPKS